MSTPEDELTLAQCATRDMEALSYLSMVEAAKAIEARQREEREGIEVKRQQRSMVATGGTFRQRLMKIYGGEAKKG